MPPSSKLHPGPCSSVGVWPRTDTHTHTHTDTQTTLLSQAAFKLTYVVFSALEVLDDYCAI